MTSEQKLKVLYNLLENVEFDEMFYNVYTSILSLNDRTPHGIHHVSYDKLIKKLKSEDKDSDLLCTLEDTSKLPHSDYITSKDVSLFVLNPFEDVDLVILKIHDMDDIGGEADASNTLKRYATDGLNRIHSVDIMVFAEQRKEILSGYSRYVYNILGHEIIHFILRYLNYTPIFNGKIDTIFGYGDELMECLCDLWAFALVEYITYYNKYSDYNNLLDAFGHFMKLNDRRPAEHNIKFTDTFAKVGNPKWLTNLINRTCKK